jgi:hypothetical protein
VWRLRSGKCCRTEEVEIVVRQSPGDLDAASRDLAGTPMNLSLGRGAGVGDTAATMTSLINPMVRRRVEYTSAATRRRAGQTELETIGRRFD